jgi:single-stranded-DNA-specific exonuclease
VGADHIRITMGNESGQRVRGIAFRSVGSPLGTALMARQTLHICGKLSLNTWQNRNEVEIQVEDAAVASI